MAIKVEPTIRVSFKDERIDTRFTFTSEDEARKAKHLLTDYENLCGVAGWAMRAPDNMATLNLVVQADERGSQCIYFPGAADTTDAVAMFIALNADAILEALGASRD